MSRLWALSLRVEQNCPSLTPRLYIWFCSRSNSVLRFPFKWVPTENNGIADAISRLWTESVTRLQPHPFHERSEATRPFYFDHMTSSEPAKKNPVSGDKLPLYSHYDFESVSGWRKTSGGSNARIPNWLVTSPPPRIVLVITNTQHLPEWQTHSDIRFLQYMAFGSQRCNKGQRSRSGHNKRYSVA